MMNVYYFHHQADELLGTASEQFLGKSVKEIKQTILQTLEGHLRAILGLYIGRKKLSEQSDGRKIQTFLSERASSPQPTRPFLRDFNGMTMKWRKKMIPRPKRRLSKKLLMIFVKPSRDF
jgi:hypothetical protein